MRVASEAIPRLAAQMLRKGAGHFRVLSAIFNRELRHPSNHLQRIVETKAG